SRVSQAEPGADAGLVWTFPHSMAVLGPWQRYWGYCILISRLHADELLDLPADAARGLFDEMMLLGEAIRDVVRPRKLNFELLGNQVAHPHWHIFPRPADDPHPLQPVWVDLADAERDETQRQLWETGPVPSAETIARLRQALARRVEPVGGEGARA
ncbi:MAG TPA: HIT family protein, partial [Gemmatales bacterium]|nr:HIT family protein [Gemmatales bacterium]